MDSVVLLNAGICLLFIGITFTIYTALSKQHKRARNHRATEHLDAIKRQLTVMPILAEMELINVIGNSRMDEKKLLTTPHAHKQRHQPHVDSAPQLTILDKFDKNMVITSTISGIDNLHQCAENPLETGHIGESLPLPPVKNCKQFITLSQVEIDNEQVLCEITPEETDHIISNVKSEMNEIKDELQEIEERIVNTREQLQDIKNDKSCKMMQQTDNNTNAVDKQLEQVKEKTQNLFKAIKTAEEKNKWLLSYTKLLNVLRPNSDIKMIKYQ